jgi:hypothetical protein
MEGAVQLASELDSHAIIVMKDGEEKEEEVMLLGEVTITQCAGNYLHSFVASSSRTVGRWICEQ